jgi:hypothetical protein
MHLITHSFSLRVGLLEHFAGVLQFVRNEAEPLRHLALPDDDDADPAWERRIAIAADRGPIFLPWHRVMLTLLESNLRRVLSDATFGLPYWDWARGWRSVLGCSRMSDSRSPSAQ